VADPLTTGPLPVALTADASAADIRIRPLRSTEDFLACVELQRDVWGHDQPEIVPTTLLHVVEFVGGLVAGAFDASGSLIGFVFGITGVRDGVLVHWSHQLGVRPAARNFGIGRLLKEYQRSAMAALGVRDIYWSFDPLMAKNAYLNLNKLGGAIAEYVPDMYGTTASPLHLGMPTDRLVVRLDTTPRPIPPLAPVPDDLPVLTAFPQPGDTLLKPGNAFPSMALIETPPDMLEVVERSPAAAKVWRMSVREHFQWVLANGYAVLGIHRHPVSGRAFYVISKEKH
jgi:predicted GNAT superfamily acetyltransferase